MSWNRTYVLLPPDEMNRLFLRLMIDHHQGAIPMSEAALQRSDRPVVERLAGSIISSQQAEIELMQDMLRGADEARPGNG